MCERETREGRGLRSVPDFVIEVLSPAAASHDQIVTLAVYERVGVAEVWLVHPTDRVLSIQRLEGSRHGRAQIHKL